jgi:hypothetical protein
MACKFMGITAGMACGPDAKITGIHICSSLCIEGMLFPRLDSRKMACKFMCIAAGMACGPDAKITEIHNCGHQPPGECLQ